MVNNKCGAVMESSMSDESTRYVNPATWHWLSAGAANIAYALLLAVLTLAPVIAVVGSVMNGIMFGGEIAFVFTGAATVLALYFLGVSAALAEFQTNGVPVIT